MIKTVSRVTREQVQEAAERRWPGYSGYEISLRRGIFHLLLVWADNNYSVAARGVDYVDLLNQINASKQPESEHAHPQLVKVGEQVKQSCIQSLNKTLGVPTQI